MPRRPEGEGGSYRERYSYRQGWEDPRLNEEDDYGNRGNLDYEDPHRDEDDDFQPWRRQRRGRGREPRDEEGERAPGIRTGRSARRPLDTEFDDDTESRRAMRGRFREMDAGEANEGSRYAWPSFGAEFGQERPAQRRPQSFGEPHGGEERRQRGSHFGKGPSGFRRSDERIREDICEQLWRSPEIDARQVLVDVQDGTVRLSGYVETKQMKRDAEDLAESVMGVTEVTNELRMRKPEERSE